MVEGTDGRREGCPKWMDDEWGGVMDEIWGEVGWMPCG